MAYKSSFLHRSGAWVLGLPLLLGPASLGGAQVLQKQPSVIQQDPRQGNSPEEVWEEQQRKAMAKRANTERQQEIKKDTEKLLELATELKQSVDRSSENTLSLDVVKKAEQIEKLAKSVKEKMKGP